MKPGIHTIPSEEYHADPCEAPSLSASLAHLLVNTTPLHAWCAHPRLNPGFQREEKHEFDLGNVAHLLILEGTSERVRVIEADSWRKKETQEQRDEARAEGFIPLLEKDYERVDAAVSAIRTQLMARSDSPPLFSAGKPEQTLVWEERGVWCRARLDWLHDDHSAIDDLKTTTRSANPIAWANRTAWSIGSDIQVAFYLRGMKHLTGKEPQFRYVLAETAPPFGISVVSLAPTALELGQAKVERALEKWRECLRTDNWPGYPPEIYYADAPAWAELQWLEQDGEVVLT